MPDVPVWVEHPDAYIAGVEARIKANGFKDSARWLEEDPTRGADRVAFVAAQKNAFFNRMLNAYFDWGTLTFRRSWCAALATRATPARQSAAVELPKGPKATPFVIAAAAAGKAVVARRERLGHEPKPVVDTFPRFVAEAKQYLARAANKPVHAIKGVGRASERAREIIRVVEIRERLRVGRTERCAYQVALKDAEAPAGPLNAGEKA